MEKTKHANGMAIMRYCHIRVDIGVPRAVLYNSTGNIGCSSFGNSVSYALGNRCTIHDTVLQLSSIEVSSISLYRFRV